jgi:glucose-1-phosphate cytidylyltransferase
MKVVILAGGRGTRLSEETTSRPKPMVEVGGKPLLWHVMSIYARFGYRDFLVACGYKGEIIKEYFHNYLVHNTDFFIDLRDGSREVVTPNATDWRVGLLDTGLDTQTGGRIRRLKPWLESGTFMATYGDGVADVDVSELVSFHRRSGKLATVTAVRPPARFGALEIDGDLVTEFSEKHQVHEGWINGGFFVFEPAVFDLLEGDETVLEREPLERLATAGELAAFRHDGFWQPMDTLREKHYLEALWASGEPPWMPHT